MRSLTTLLHSARLPHCIAIAAITWVTSLYSGGLLFNPPKQAAIAIVVLLTAGVSMMHFSHLQQMYLRKGDDWVTDANPVKLQIVAFFCDAGAFVAAFYWLPQAFVPVFAIILLSALYTWILSRHWQTKTPTILLIVLSPFLIGWIAGNRTGAFPWLPFITIGCLLTARELIKDVQDIEIDRAEYRATLPIRFGAKPTKFIIGIFMTVGILLPFAEMLLYTGWCALPYTAVIILIVWAVTSLQYRYKWVPTTLLFAAIVCVIAGMLVQILS